MKLIPILAIGTLALTLPLSAQTKGPKKKPDAAKVDKIPPRPNQHLVEAKALFDQGKLEEAATKIYKAVDGIGKRMLTADSLPTEGVIRATNNLETLAERVSEGKIKDGEILDQHFAKANLEMSKYYAELAKVAAGEQKPRLTRSALGRVANYIENTALWSGQKLKKENQATVTKMRETGNAADKAGKTVTPESEELAEKAPSIIERLSTAFKVEPKTPKKPYNPRKKR